jgi:NAD(P)-dependent dehydrogenase (short-subunit alcohol dehydrogenase family)
MTRRDRRGRWTVADIPDQTGRVAVVTGGNTGLGLETARALSRRGAAVVLACRNLGRGEAAADRLRSEGGSPDVSVVRLDLASLTSIHRGAQEIRDSWPRLDLLVNNAGVMDLPYQLSEDGHELMFAVNHLGHFALTGLLLDRLLATSGSRVVTVSSGAHRRAALETVDADPGRQVGRGDAYARSKLANLLFTYELQHRLDAADASTVALAAHPGNARTDLMRNSGRLERAAASPRLRYLTRWLLQSPRVGALATLRAATDPTARGGDYYGPPGRLQFTGHPTRVESSPHSHDRAAQRRLWELSERLTGVTYRIATPSG